MERKKPTRTSKGSGDTTVDSVQAKDNPDTGSIVVPNVTSTPEVRHSPAVIIPVSECRRSSRKKIIKFDVRDLLNKNRKPHKIQIEARIDSNVPTTSKAVGSTSCGEVTANKSGSNVGNSQDLSSKQKTFMEKSAIFRRFSVSQEQTKPPPPPPLPIPPTMLSKVSESKDTLSSINAAGKRLNRTQEYYNNALLKPKHTTSLIVAQVESNVRSVELTRNINQIGEGSKRLETQKVTVAETPPQKRRGRPPKARAKDSMSEYVKDQSFTDRKETNDAKLSPEKATNWKEYKACLAQRSNSSTEEPLALKESELLPSVATLENFCADTAIVTTKGEMDLEKSNEKAKKAIENIEVTVSSEVVSVHNKSFDKNELVTADDTENKYLERKSKDTDNNKIRSPTTQNVDESATKYDSRKSLPFKNENKNLEITENTLQIMHENAKLCSNEVNEEKVSEEESDRLRRTSSSSISDNSNHTCVSSTTAASYGSSRKSVDNNFKTFQQIVSSETSSSEFSTSKETNSSVFTVSEIKRSKRLQRKNNDKKHTVTNVENSNFDVKSVATNEDLNRLNDSDNLLSETSINLVENTSMDSSSTGDVIPDEYKCELRTTLSSPENEHKSSTDERLQSSEENDSNDSQSSAYLKNKTVNKQRKSLRKQTSEQFKMEEKKCDNNRASTSLEEKVIESNPQDINIPESKNVNTGDEVVKAHVTVDTSKELDKTERDVAIENKEKENIKSTMKTKTLNENQSTDKRKSLRKQKYDNISENMDINELVCEASITKEDAVYKNQEKEGNVASAKGDLNDPKQTSDESPTTSKRKSLRKQTNNSVSSSSENDSNDSVTAVSKVNTSVAKNEKILPKTDSKSIADKATPTSMQRKSLRKTKSDGTVSPQTLHEDESTGKCTRPIAAHSKSPRTEPKNLDDGIPLSTRQSLRKQKDDDTFSPQKSNEDESIGKCKTGDEIDFKSPPHDNSQKIEQKTFDDNSTVATKKSLRKQKDDGSVSPKKHNEKGSFEECKSGEEIDRTTPTHDNSQIIVDDIAIVSTKKSLRKEKDGGSVSPQNLNDKESFEKCKSREEIDKTTPPPPHDNSQKTEQQPVGDNSTVATTKSLRKQKDDGSVSPQNLNVKGSFEECKSGEEIGKTTPPPPHDNSQKIEQQPVGDNSTSATKESLRKQKHDGSVSPQKLDEKESFARCKSGEEIDKTTPPYDNSQKIELKPVDDRSTVSTKKSLRIQKDVGSVSPQKLDKRESFKKFKSGEKLGRTTPTHDNSPKTELKPYDDNSIFSTKISLRKQKHDGPVSPQKLDEKESLSKCKSGEEIDKTTPQYHNSQKIELKSVDDSPTVSTKKSVRIQKDFGSVSLQKLDEKESFEKCKSAEKFGRTTPTLDNSQKIEQIPVDDITTVSTKKLLRKQKEGDGSVSPQKPTEKEIEKITSTHNDSRKIEQIDVEETLTLATRKSLRKQKDVTRCSSPLTKPSKNMEEIVTQDAANENSQSSEEYHNTSKRITKRKSLKKVEEDIVDTTLEDVVKLDNEIVLPVIKKEQSNINKPLEDDRILRQVDLKEELIVPSISEQVPLKTAEDLSELCPSEGVSVEESFANDLAYVDKTTSTVRKSLRNQKYEISSTESFDEGVLWEVHKHQTPTKSPDAIENQDHQLKKIVQRKSPRNQKDDYSAASETMNNEKLNQVSADENQSITEPNTISDVPVTTLQNDTFLSESINNEKQIKTLNVEETDIKCCPPEMESSQTPEETQIVKKKRTRKSRFKNLHGPDSDPENANTIIADCKTMEIAKSSSDVKTEHSTSRVVDNIEISMAAIKSLTVPGKLDIFGKNVEHSNKPLTIETLPKDFPENKKTFDKTSQSLDLPLTSQPESTSSYVIKNLSIETGTLLDILRTVQSNQEAAEEAKKTGDTAADDQVLEQTPSEIQKVSDSVKEITDFKILADETKKAVDSTEVQDSEPSSYIGSSANNSKSRKKIFDSNSNSPCRSDSASPLTFKKVSSSPRRSNSSSPITLKKSNISPSRSDTSSPFSLSKKLTRRYEKRNRRGDDSPHKTLEETFAEIAALSSQAVLEMSSKSDVIENVEIIAEEPQPTVITEHPEAVKIDLKEFDTKDSNECKFQQNNEVTPTRISRQSKSRSTKSETPFSGKMSPMLSTQQRLYNEHEICKESVNLSDPSEFATPDIGKPKSIVITTDCNILTDTQEYHPNIDQDQNENIETNTLVLTKNLEDESKNNLNDTLSGLKGETDSVAISDADKITSAQQSPKNTPTKEVESATQVAEECKTPKSCIKKRDISIGKSESNSKSSSKKLIKKTKLHENIETSKLEESVSIKQTTTPPQKRGRKPKTTTQTDAVPCPPNNSGGKKNLKKEQKEEVTAAETKYELENDSETLTDEKIAKKKRQRKLKEAFEEALNDPPVALKEFKLDTPPSYVVSDGSYTGGKSPPYSETESSFCEEANKSGSQATTIEPEEDPDPLKDIEKFIEDGVNLLKKDYKIDDDSVDTVLVCSATHTKESPTDMLFPMEGGLLSKEIATPSFETPADTPIATPSVTPPPKSPESPMLSEEHSSGGVRRSHRIKLITKAPKALVGRGLVRDKERFSIKDDVETKSHYTLDDHLLDLAEVEAKNAKFLKEMEERLSNFQVIKENEYKCERVISKEARKMICDCFLTAEEEERGELACGEDCLNRLLMIECGPECNVKDRCTNKRFQKLLCSPCRVFRTEKKGFGIMADIEILAGEFIMEYVGEVIDTEEFEGRRVAYSQDKNRHYYFMALRSDAIIDATIKGNISRFINHSCDPNAETQKWTVNGELRIGFFSRKSIMPGEEITFDYQYQRYGREAQRCYCESANCRGWIGQEPNSDEGEQIDDDDESDEDEDEEEDTSNLLEEDDEDSDASVSDPEEVQKKLEMAAAQAAAELAPIHLEDKSKDDEEKSMEKEEVIAKSETEEEDSKSKFKKLLSKMAEKVAAKHKQTKREQKLQRKKKSKEISSEIVNKQRFLEDPDIEDEVEFLSRCGLKNQSDTLRLSRLMVRAKLVQTRLNLLDILRKGELPCRRLFLDYHGLRLVHGWMSEDAGNMQIRLALLETLELLPIANKTVLTDSKVMQVVRSWCGSNAALSPSDDSLSSNSNSQDAAQQQCTSRVNAEEGISPECGELQKLALKLINTWDGLPEIFRIPKKERIEQMKEHEREADRQYAETEGSRYSSTDRTNRFGKRVNTAIRRFGGKPHCSKQLPNLGNAMRSSNMTPENLQYLSKAQRREMFAAKVARDEAEKRMAEERREFETKCRFFGLDPKKTRPQDIPFCVNPATGQWYSVDRKPITTPPSYAHVHVPLKPKSTNPADYQLPAICNTLPPQWKYALTPLGQIYYYHVQYRVPQWEPPTHAQLQHCEINADEVDSGNEHTPSTGADSSDDDDNVLIGMDASQLKAYIDRKVELRRQKRYQRLVDERAISPRREEDRVYNQLEVRKYKENKEKIRKRKEEIRRKRAEALRQSSLNMCTLGSLTDVNTIQAKPNETEDDGALPIQDYLLSSDEDDDIKVEVNSPLIDKIVEGDKIVDELDALTTKRPLKRPLPPHRDLNEPSTSSSSTSTSSSLAAIERQEYKKRKIEKKEKRKPKEQDAKYRRTKEKFRCEIAGIIVHHLKPYRKDTCMAGRIQSNDDFNHLARKLTHFVMIKELKYCESVGQTLVVTESVKNKSREFIKKYMTKYGDVYVKPANDPEFKDIPFTL